MIHNSNLLENYAIYGATEEHNLRLREYCLCLYLLTDIDAWGFDNDDWIYDYDGSYN